MFRFFFSSEMETSDEDKLRRCSGGQLHIKDLLRLLAEIHFINAEVCKHMSPRSYTFLFNLLFMVQINPAVLKPLNLGSFSAFSL